jgi:uncharacterized phage protein (TIGR02218 family)
MGIFQTESSVQASRPVELYRIVVAGTAYTLTTHTETVTSGGVDYLPHPIQRGPIQAVDANRNDVSVKVRSDLACIAQFQAMRPSDVTSVSIMRAQLSDPDEVVTIFSGAVSEVRFTDQAAVAELRISPERKLTNRPCPSRGFGGRCSWSLYGQGCGVSPDLHSVTGEILEVDDRRLVIPVAAGEVDGYFADGSIEFSHAGGVESRAISSHKGDVIELTLPYPTNVLFPGLVVKLLAGCDRKYSTCSAKFQNNTRFGGFASIPLINPTTDGIQQ